MLEPINMSEDSVSSRDDKQSLEAQLLTHYKQHKPADPYSNATGDKQPGNVGRGRILSSDFKSTSSEEYTSAAALQQSEEGVTQIVQQLRKKANQRRQLAAAASDHKPTKVSRSKAKKTSKKHTRKAGIPSDPRTQSAISVQRLQSVEENQPDYQDPPQTQHQQQLPTGKTTILLSNSSQSELITAKQATNGQSGVSPGLIDYAAFDVAEVTQQEPEPPQILPQPTVAQREPSRNSPAAYLALNYQSSFPQGTQSKPQRQSRPQTGDHQRRTQASLVGNSMTQRQSTQMIGQPYKDFSVATAFFSRQTSRPQSSGMRRVATSQQMFQRTWKRESASSQGYQIKSITQAQKQPNQEVLKLQNQSLSSDGDPGFYLASSKKPEQSVFYQPRESRMIKNRTAKSGSLSFLRRNVQANQRRSQSMLKGCLIGPVRKQSTGSPAMDLTRVSGLHAQTQQDLAQTAPDNRRARLQRRTKIDFIIKNKQVVANHRALIAYTSQGRVPYSQTQAQVVNTRPQSQVQLSARRIEAVGDGKVSYDSPSSKNQASAQKKKNRVKHEQSGLILLESSSGSGSRMSEKKHKSDVSVSETQSGRSGAQSIKFDQSHTKKQLKAKSRKKRRTKPGSPTQSNKRKRNKNSLKKTPKKHIVETKNDVVRVSESDSESKSPKGSRLGSQKGSRSGSRHSPQPERKENPPQNVKPLILAHLPHRSALTKDLIAGVLAAKHKGATQSVSMSYLPAGIRRPMTSNLRKRGELQAPVKLEAVKQAKFVGKFVDKFQHKLLRQREEEERLRILAEKSLYTCATEVEYHE